MIVLIAGPQKPPRSYQGLGLPYLAAVLEKNGFETRIRDLYPPSAGTDDPAVLDERLAEQIAGLGPSIVGITVHTPTVAERTHLARCLRRKLPDTLLVAGGHHATAEPEDLLQRSDFDVCAIGEGEYTLLEIARRADADGRRDAHTWLHSVPGIAYKQGDRIANTGPGAVPIDFDSLPMQAHHLLGLENYAPYPLLGVKTAGLLTYRGCPMRCAFCLNPQGNRVRRRTPGKVVDEIETVMREFDITGFTFRDNMFGLSRRHAAALCDEILRRKLDIVWECWTGGSLVTAELAAKMKAAGCIRVGFGAESGDDEVLGRSRRGFSAAQHQAGITALRSAGLKVEAYFMLGLPGESGESVRRTVAFAKECGADAVVMGVFRPYPGTAVWHDPDAFGVRITRGPNFEAYVETEALSRPAILECAQMARKELNQAGLGGEFLRCDRYAWETGQA